MLRWRRLEYDFLACMLMCLASYFSFFVFSFLSFLIFFLHPGMFIFFVSRRLCSSNLLLLSATTYFIVRVLSVVSFVPYPILESFFYLFSIFFRNSYFSDGIFVVVLSYPVR